MATKGVARAETRASQVGAEGVRRWVAGRARRAAVAPVLGRRVANGGSWRKRGVQDDGGCRLEGARLGDGGAQGRGAATGSELAGRRKVAGAVTGRCGRRAGCNSERVRGSGGNGQLQKWSCRCCSKLRSAGCLAVG
ncbi:hypothetical protein ACJRO7_019977 [Eucalyptus globulus]|uniref:Uncharacterized protein n=1 Tax=Eucalyptus globulus TaxID=34317 RepID=A0ABD3KN66_EUCGL